MYLGYHVATAETSGD